MDPQIVIPAVAGIGLAYVFLPVIGGSVVSALGPHKVRCPENEEEVSVGLDLRRAAMTAFTSGQQQVVRCSRWPERAGCDRGCEARLRG